MKKLWIIALAALMLAGCGAEPTFETVGDVYDVPAEGKMQQILTDLPPEAVTPVMEKEGAGQLYMCDGYSLILQTVPAGNLQETLLTVTGFTPEQLPLQQTSQGSLKRYDWVWTAAGEGQSQVCRGAILDDGSYHYILTAQADETAAGALAETWQSIFGSFRLAPEEMISTGS